VFLGYCVQFGVVGMVGVGTVMVATGHGHFTRQAPFGLAVAAAIVVFAHLLLRPTLLLGEAGLRVRWLLSSHVVPWADVEDIVVAPYAGTGRLNALQLGVFIRCRDGSLVPTPLPGSPAGYPWGGRLIGYGPVLSKQEIASITADVRRLRTWSVDGVLADEPKRPHRPAKPRYRAKPRRRGPR